MHTVGLLSGLIMRQLGTVCNQQTDRKIRKACVQIEWRDSNKGSNNKDLFVKRGSARE